VVQKETVTRLVEEWMEDTPFFLVDIRITNENDVFVEFESEADEVSIDDCVDLSKYLEEQLDREKEDFSLEVGSAGLGQPFKVLKQFLINLGEEMEVVLKSGKKFTGVLKDADEAGFTVSVSRKVKAEGAKKPMTVDADERYAHSDVKSVRYLIRFS
jgi:ribosome maturation factor RimP